MGFGKGAAGSNGNGFQLLMVIFVELFGVTLGQMIAAISPSVQVCTSPTSAIASTKRHVDRCLVQSLPWSGTHYVRWCDYPLPDLGEVLEVLALPTDTVHSSLGCDVIDGIAVSSVAFVRGEYALTISSGTQWFGDSMPGG